MVNTILREADLFCPNSVRINFTIYLIKKGLVLLEWKYFPTPKILDPYICDLPRMFKSNLF
ncbi:MAG: hypothetical protein DQL95_11320 (plasmid) [Lactobacillus helveticus]|nr:MAG: hypothetical protein DQL95_11320 [Lactobacillus helveticus]AZA22690.1 MAG: hypothetical protein DQL94_11835 [Lactobacillus helveticus]NHL85614.1 hypothetical protein [Lactobacillus helveticus]